MKRILLALLLIAAALPAYAQSNIIGSGIIGDRKVAGGSPVSITYPSASSSQVESSGGSTITYTAMDIGAADPNRVVAVVISARFATASNITSVTVGGISATQATSAFDGVKGAAVWYASVPTGTTANVVVVYPAATLQTMATTYRIITTTPTPSSSSSINSVGGVSSLSTNITVPASGGYVAGDINTGATGFPQSWNLGATKDLDTNAGRSYSTAHNTTTTGAITVTVTPTAGNQMGMAAAAWAP